MEKQQYCLKWNTFNATISTSLNKSQKLNEFVDVTLSAEGQNIHAHKIILSACSPYFRNLFIDEKIYSMQHPVLILIRDITFEELQTIIEFMYHGEVCVAQEKLSSLLRAADALKVRGLTTDPGLQFESGKYSITPIVEEEPKPIEPEPQEYNALTANTICRYLASGLFKSLDPPSHNTHAKHTSNPTPPTKKRKLLSSPHASHNSSGHSNTPGNTPPNLISTPSHTPDSTPNYNKDKHLKTPPSLMQIPFNPVFNSSTEDDGKVVNLSMNNNDHHHHHSPIRMAKEEPTDELPPPPRNCATQDMEHGNDDDKAPPPLIIPDEDSKERHEINSPQNMTMSMGNVRPNYGFYDALAGSSGVLTSSPSQTWRGSVPTETVDSGPTQAWRPPSAQQDTGTDPQGSHPVFNELFGEGASCGGKKAVPTPCPVCQKVLSNPYNMRVHLETHEDTTYKCIICGIYTRTRDTMRKHCSNVHQLRNIELKQSFKKVSGKGEPGMYFKTEKGGNGKKSSKHFSRYKSAPTLLKPKQEILSKTDDTNESKDSEKQGERYFPFNPLSTFPSLLQPESILGQTIVKSENNDDKQFSTYVPLSTSYSNLSTPAQQEPITSQSSFSVVSECDATLAKGSSLASIVNKLSQKQ